VGAIEAVAEALRWVASMLVALINSATARVRKHKAMSLMHRKLLGLATSCSVLVLASVSSAQDPTVDTGQGPSRAFGHARQLALSSDVALLIQRSSQDSTTVQFAPAADYFVIDNFSIGGVILVDYTQARSVDTTRFSIGPRVGYNIPFTDLIGLWPKLGFSYSHTSVSTDLPSGSDDEELSVSASGNHISLNLFAPLMCHPVPHFFVGFGPFLDADLSGDNKTTTFGGRLTLGGWLEL
jgi:hypothetical protein